MGAEVFHAFLPVGQYVAGYQLVEPAVEHGPARAAGHSSQLAGVDGLNALGVARLFEYEPGELYSGASTNTGDVVQAVCLSINKAGSRALPNRCAAQLLTQHTSGPNDGDFYWFCTPRTSGRK
jgi:hypothetical protein